MNQTIMITPNFYRAVIKYCGYPFLGWQIQTKQGLTIQGELIKALALVSKSDDVEVIGSSRTDAGVHALGQVARLRTPLDISPDSLLRAINVKLPQEIRIINIERADGDFHPSFHAKSKEYSYFFHQALDPDPFFSHLITNISYELDEELLKMALKLFVGTHDFRNFMTVGTPVKSTIRTIYNIEMKKHSIPNLFPGLSNVTELTFHGNGFLKQMIRLIVGSLWSVSRRKLSLAELEGHLAGNPWVKRPATAPANGLYLKNIIY